MSFVDGVFLPFFLLTYAGFLLLRNSRSLQSWWLLLLSLCFYGWKNPADILLLSATSALSFWGAKALEESRSQRIQRLLLIVSILVMVAPLCFFKYWPLVESSWKEFPHFDRISTADSKQQLPLGISFFTFQALSYLIDVYRKKIERAANFRDYFLYITFFPQLVAGPITRAQDLLPQLPKAFRKQLPIEGGFLIIYGLVKKVFGADLLGQNFVDPVFRDIQNQVGVDLWIAAFAYSFQIFLDFSAYSDIATGLARFFGIQLPKNFDVPYSSSNPREFWRRWHITLSSWFRDYLYIPLGGSRSPHRLGRIMPVVLTMLLCGIWHGANWTFVAWGVWHAGLQLGHRGLIPVLSKLKIPSYIFRFCFFILLTVGWVFFRSDTLADSFLFIGRMLECGVREFASVAGILAWAFLLLAFVNGVEVKKDYLASKFERLPVLLHALAWVLLLISLIETKRSAGDQAFIYFQF